MKTIAVNKYKEAYDVYVGRGSIFGNPYKIGEDGNREEVLIKYKKWFKKQLKNPEFKAEVLALKGKRLGCFCKPLACHADIIISYINYYYRKYGKDWTNS